MLNYVTDVILMVQLFIYLESMKTYEVEIQNLKCGGCANSIKNSLTDIEGVSDILVNEETSLVKMKINDEKLISGIHEELNSMGYPVVGDENSFGKKAKSYVSCAIGRIS